MSTVYAQAMVACSVCGNETPQAAAVDVSDDPDPVYVGAECIMGWFVWQELQGTRSYIEMRLNDWQYLPGRN